MNKTLIIFTGGTISMSADPESGASVPGVSGSDILAGISNLDSMGDFEVIEFADLPSPQITPRHMLSLALFVRKELKRKEISSVIVSHGTDTLEETAYFLDLAVESKKPIVFVGSMRNISELGYDGPSNLAGAIVTARSKESIGRGVLIVLNNQVNSAREATKSNTLSLDTFRSLEFGPLGVVDNNEVLYFRDANPRSHILVDSIEEKVYLLKAYAGIGREEVDFFVSSGAKGIVIEALGRGNLTPVCAQGVEEAIRRGVHVTIVSRCPTGRVLWTYGYEGAGKQLKEAGAYFGPAINGQKMRIKMMLALSLTDDPEKLRPMIELDAF
ncbi:MAG: asparaginase [Tissierellia bacterium]|nr:asparaginase [Bacillota bacterium]NLL22657.1 asparaginase [Tissierellia bacterium]